MRKNAFFSIVLALALSCAGGAMAETLLPEVATPARDELMFAMCCDMAGWQAPEGYTLEGFMRTDINGDERLETVAVMRDGGQGRALVVMLSNTFGYTVDVYDDALPQATTDAADDPLYGIDIGDALLTLYTYGSGDDRFASTYSFRLDGAAFALDSLQTLRWTDSGTATREVFDYVEGWQVLEAGIIDGNAFVSGGVVDQRSFAPNTYGPQLAAFSIATCPTEWDDFAEMAGIEPDADDATDAGDTDEAEASDAALKPTADTPNAPPPGGLPEGILMPDNHKPTEAPSPPATETETTDAPEKLQCGLCGQWFEAGAPFDAHVCLTFGE